MERRVTMNERRYCGCMDCKDKVAGSDETPWITCSHETCPYFDIDKMKNNGIESYTDWIIKGYPDNVLK